MTDKHLQRIIEDNVINKYISKYRGITVDEPTKKDMIQDIYVMMLEAMMTEKYENVEDKFSYLCSIIKHQIYSDHSEVIRKYHDEKKINYSNSNLLMTYAENDSQYSDKQ